MPGVITRIELSWFTLSKQYVQTLSALASATKEEKNKSSKEEKSKNDFGGRKLKL